MTCFESAVPLRTITLLPSQASRLVSFLDEMIRSLDDRPGMDNLLAVQGRLEDACWNSQWLRDYVKLDVSPEESLDLVQALAITIAENDTSEEDEEVSVELMRQLGSSPFSSPTSFRSPSRVTKAAASLEPCA